MFHPWRRLRAQPQIDVTWRAMPDRLGATDGRCVIVMHPHQSQVQRRCTLAHELAHIELGHVDGCSDADERTATLLAARWLVDMEQLLSALRWAEDMREVADECWVDVPTLMARLDGLTCDERDQIRALCEGMDHTC